MLSKIKKSINIWAFSPDNSVEECMRIAKDAGFDGIELAFSKTGECSLESSEEELKSIRRKADEIGITLCSLATGLYWECSFTANEEQFREKAKEVCRRQIDAAAVLGIDCVLVTPGTVGVDFRPEDVVPDADNVSFFAGSEVIDYDVAYERSQAALKELAPYAEERGVIIGIENIWNKFLLSPLEFRNFLDEIGSSNVAAFLDVGNMMLFGYPHHWIKILNKRIKKVHFKDFRRDVQRLSGFVDLLAGDVDWPTVIDAFEAIGYDGWASAECCPNYKYYTNQIVYNASAAMDCILGRKPMP